MLKDFFLFIWEVVKIVIIAFLIVLPIRYFVFQPFLVRGQSMEPNFKDGDYLIIDEISPRFYDYQRGEVIVFKYPQNPTLRYIKRVVGLPGETVKIKDGRVIITKDGFKFLLDETKYLPDFVQTPGDLEMTLSPGEYFVMGDNRLYSADSRKFGILPAENIVGRVLLRAWPVEAMAIIEAPGY